MNQTAPFSDKQLEFIRLAEAKYNLAHGSVRSGKTVCTLFKFLQAAFQCPGDTIVIFGYSMGSIYNNVISLLYNSPELNVFRPYCNWSSKGVLKFALKDIFCIGAGDEGSLGKIQGMSIDLSYCDEMTLYPDNVIDMIQTRHSRAHSRLYAAMNPKQPSHKLKQWIDRSETDSQYYALHFTLDDNPYLEQSFKDDLKRSLSGLFYKRNYLGLWCLAEGAIYDFFDPAIHVVRRPPRAAEYWICSIDYGTHNPFAALLIGVSTGKYDQTGRRWWVEKEYYWDPKKTNRQKTNSEFKDDIIKFIEPYAVKNIYVDPSAASFKLELRKAGLHVVDANNDVDYGIQQTMREIQRGNLTICNECVNLIREIEAYVWDSKAAERGEDEPMKRNGVYDHACDALRYAIATHKISEWNEDEYYRKQQLQMRNAMQPGVGFR